MKPIQRREFIKNSATLAGGAVIAPAYIPNFISDSPNERVNIALVGISGERKLERGMIKGREQGFICTKYAEIPNVRIKTICDVDERLFPAVSETVEEIFGVKPKDRG